MIDLSKLGIEKVRVSRPYGRTVACFGEAAADWLSLQAEPKKRITVAIELLEVSRTRYKLGIDGIRRLVKHRIKTLPFHNEAYHNEGGGCVH